MTHEHAIEPAAQVLEDLAWVRRLARRLLQDPTLAEDVAQEAWLAANQSAPPKDQDRRPWLVTVVKNHIRRLSRSQRRRSHRETTSAELRSDDRPYAEDPADIVARADLHRELTAAVMELDEPYRTAVLLRHLDDLPPPEVARRQNISHDAARKRISRGLQMLRERIEHLHPGGFAAWSAAWTTHLQSGTVAAATGAGITLPTLFVMNMKWMITGATALAAMLLWGFWPASQTSAPTPNPIETTASSQVSGDMPAAPSDTAPPRQLAPRSKAALELVLVDEQQRPLRKVLVLSLQAGELSQQARSDDNGRVAFHHAADATELLLARAGCVPMRLPLPTGSDRQQIVYATGHQVAGQVEGTAQEPVILHLEHDVVADCWTGLGSEARTALLGMGVLPNALEIKTSEDLRFAFCGLPANWTGALLTTNGWTLQSAGKQGAMADDATLLLLAPSQDLLLKLQSPIELHGRLLAGENPIAGLRILALDARTQSDGTLPETRSDVHGRFQIHVARPQANSRGAGTSLLVCSGNETVLEHRIKPGGEMDVRDVGDLQVGAPLTVHVHGKDGKSLQGASVVVGARGERSIHASTDTQGQAQFAALSIAAETIRVTAPGHDSAQLEIPTSRDVHVQLHQANEITVQIVNADGSAASDLRVRLQCDRQPFVAARQSRASDKPFAATFEPQSNGTLRLSNLEPGVLLTLTAVDDLEQAVGQLEVAAPPPLRRDTVTLKTNEQPFFWRGVVTDANGRPVPRAKLHAEANSFATHARTDATGAFAIGPMRREIRGLHVEVSHPMFVTWVADELAATQQAEPLAITIQRGRTLRAHVLQQCGNPVTAAMVYLAIAPNGGGVGKSQIPGVFVFDRMARKEGVLTVSLAGQEFTMPVAADDDYVEMRVPDLATLNISLSSAFAPEPGTMVCVAITAIEPEGPCDRRYLPRNAAPGTTQLRQLPPGRYRLQLEQRRLGRRGVDLLGAAQEVVVQGGDSREVALP